MTTVDLTNKQAYTRLFVVQTYARSAPGLSFPESHCLDLIPPAARGKVLDIGIGTGRTTLPVAKLFRSYVGIDRSAALVAASRKHHPGFDLRLMDASSLEFDADFDCVFFSMNGIDSVEMVTRMKILSEMHRVLKPGGYLLYSTHNLRHHRVRHWLDSFWVDELHKPLKRLRFIANRLRNFRKRRVDANQGVAYVNDPGIGFRMINAYLDIEREKTRLARLGVEIIAMMGNKKQTPGYDADDCWVYILARKPAT